MKRERMKQLIALFLLAAGSALFALETGFEFRSSNLCFPWEWDEPLPASTTAFPGDLFYWGGEVWLSQSLGEDANIRVAYDRDPVLRNSLSATIEFDQGVTRIAVGPRFGLFNSEGVPFSAGLTSSVRLQWPGIAYVSMRSDGSLALGVLDMSAVDPQARVDVAVGLYLRNVILSATLESKRFNDISEAGATVSTDSWTRYAVELDIYKKNVPYTFLGSVGYETRSKRYTAADSTDSLGAVMLGAESRLSISPSLTLIMGLDSGFYVFGLDNLKNRNPAKSSFLYSADIGLSFDVFEMGKELAAFRASRAAAKAEAQARAAAKLAAEEEAKAVAEAAAPEPGDNAAETPAATEIAEPEPPLSESETAPEASAEELPSEGTEPAASPWVVSLGTGVAYNFTPLPEGPFSILAALFNIRGGAFVSVERRLGKTFGIGGEIGLQYMTTSSDGAATNTHLFDLPLHAAAPFSFGKAGLTLFAGGIASGVLGDTTPPFAIGYGVDGGGRLKLGAFYLEGSYIYSLSGAVGYPRAGFGFVFPLGKGDMKIGKGNPLLENLVK
jgi:hypothetical protein